MLNKLQCELVKAWTGETYSAAFNSSPSKYNDFDHAIKHVQKALGRLVEMSELADHGTPAEVAFRFEDARKYLADVVICAARLANTIPGGVDLEMAVVDRMRSKMNVDLYC